ncbi:mitotic fidelity of chromosome transmission- protein [Purpureocillium takamizusanense]|uniref:CENP-C homolog n=1 Tax=Purpureocillium takamizusanense TaxID=2060973 RepID=A0A9Q8QJ37_9HYPO|nr:mitotic fidelity of chromosome transmission- protein [Purpureocillium takamizusanense]UNI20187.1 mitotic fidelity of chromosome transmission- protein [Purpureocillium takamizusanense]
MAPRARRGDAVQQQAIHEFGKQGRKTGVFLPDDGARDEHGMQPLEAIFSSPRKTNGAHHDDDDQDDSGSEDMELASSGGPGPRTLLRNQRNTKLPLPKSKSPLKTNLKSPARRNPHMEQRLSSPTRRSLGGDRDTTVTRRLDFTGKPDKSSKLGGARPKVNGVASKRRLPSSSDDDDEDNDDESIIGGHTDLAVDDMVEQSLQMVDAMGGDDDNSELGDTQVNESAHQLPEADDDDEPPVRRPRGRPPGSSRPKPNAQQPPPTKKRRSLRGSTGGDDVGGTRQEEEDDDDDEPPRQAKRPRTKAPSASKAAPAPTKPQREPASKAKGAKTTNSNPNPNPKEVTQPAEKPKAKGRPSKKARALEPIGEDAGEASFMALQRGPPMPKSRGLVSVRRDPDAVSQTRSGRHSYRPVEYWRGEQVICEEEEQNDAFHRDEFVVPTIKEIVRVPHEAPPSRRAPRSKARANAKGKNSLAVVEDEELEEWELNPGTVTGEIVLWEPEHEEHPPADDEPVQVMDDRIAISADAIQTSDIKDATFRFAKTLTMPFMGAGVVDLPPGAEKRPKNSRKMHMVFFVHYGKVLVTINEAQFRISAGGTWFVPRGNYYSITNDYDNPSRIFFAQACEVRAPDPDASQLHNDTTGALGY